MIILDSPFKPSLIEYFRFDSSSSELRLRIVDFPPENNLGIQRQSKNNEAQFAPRKQAAAKNDSCNKYFEMDYEPFLH
ncbi:hypothetical protein PRIPAC_86116 [Pristionchus pacificus]|uniref:Uncharacterized protein n=1 Tax=Pristionchus pacificus TaxID=54126 RepID=A0A2A6CCD4_PRIPA|nr:hypothetical protein PRIPAC_86116 [Pristionchus pacificus]|eukprot:PDM75844.1 hypothetical protein PRIPAC_40223 [Pristionchus pacificus]